MRLLFIGLASGLLAFLATGCMEVAGSAAAYGLATKDQRHAAYTEYYFQTLTNGTPALPEKEWTRQYELRMEYTDFYRDAIALNAGKFPAVTNIPPLSEWQTNELVKYNAARRQNLKPPNQK